MSYVLLCALWFFFVENKYEDDDNQIVSNLVSFSDVKEFTNTTIPIRSDYACQSHTHTHTHTHNRFTPFFRDHPGEPVPEENFWTLWCKERLTEADTLTIRLGTTPSGLTSAHLHHLHHPPYARESCGADHVCSLLLGRIAVLHT